MDNQSSSTVPVPSSLASSSDVGNNRVLQNIDEGLNLVPIQNKTALLHACMVCPALVQRESPPLRFLEFEKYNCYAAAVRWAKYWDIRYNLFGPDRAFLPIADFTGNGAIPADLIEYITTGVAVVLPPDDQQRPVMFVDRSRIPQKYLHWPNEYRMKLCFAILQKIMLLSKKFILIFFASSKPRFYPGTGEWFMDALNYAFPMELSAIYLVCKSPKSRMKSFAATYFPVMLKIVNKNFRQIVVDIYIGDREELLKKLILKGLSPADLPESVGGSWKYEEYEGWVLRQRVTPCDNSLQGSVISTSNSTLKEPAAALEGPNISRQMEQLNQGFDSQVNVTNEVYVKEAIVHRPIDNFMQTEAVRNEIKAMDMMTKLAYNEALTVAPYLETIEATMDSFFSVENGNVKQAAKRAVNYWRIRKEIFKDLSLHPLQQNIGGALNEVDLRTIKCGYIALLPSNKEGNSVLCCDASRLASDDEESRLRCLFYMLRVASQQISRNSGVSVLMIMNKLSFERDKGAMNLAEILKVYPVKIASVHIIRQPARLGINVFEEKVVPAMQSIFHSLSAPIHIHSGTPTCDLRQELDAHGFDIKKLPRSLGGGWTYEDFLTWRDQQVRFEESVLSLYHRTSEATGVPSLDASPPSKQSAPLVLSHLAGRGLSCAIPHALSSSYPNELYPTQPITAPQSFDQFHLRLAQYQELVHLNQNLVPPRYHLDQVLASQQPLDQQNILKLRQVLEHQQMMTNIQKELEMQQRVGRSVTAEQKTDAKNEWQTTTTAASLADIINSLHVNQWNVN